MGPNLSAKKVRILLAACFFCLASLGASGQFNGGPRSTTAVNGHTLAPPPSVTSVGGAHLPPPAPSVTSLPNYPHQNFYGRQNYGYGPYHRGGYGGYFGYAVPYYYYPADNAYYGYDYVGSAGPDLHSGPPLGPGDPTLHMIVEQPPANRYGPPPEPENYADRSPAPAPQVPASAPEVKPGEPVVLVFRDGKQQEVTNYAIMGDTLYVFDRGKKGKKKIALADLDIPATVKANDDRGLEFRMPPAAAKKKISPAPQSSKPDQTADGPPPKIAALTP